MSKLVYSEEYLDTGAPQYLLHIPAAEPAPVLLFVHGGPGFSQSFLGYWLKKWWKEMVTLVFWDQRGCGKSLAASAKPVTYPITVDDVKRDMKAVVDHLKQRYNTQKIVVMGHSWGSVLGSLYALEHPEDLLLYIGVGQAIEMHENERRAWEALRENILEAGNTKDLAALPAFESIEYLPHLDEPQPNLEAFMRLRYKYRMLVKLGPSEILLFMRNPAFRFSDFSFFKKSVERLRWGLIDYLRVFDLQACGHTYQVPIAYLLGADDTQVSTSLAVEYFEQIQAPRKLLRVIPNAKHNTMYDAPQPFTDALREALDLIE
ncbi:MAG: alpha/beta hydrolase [Coriobacteriales bacterium]|jgi:pimeloyl-ACP methyl ester carboxylesterase|nr:alpha/beta hydrolase [Coriobacteriales bacterium]